MPFDGRKRAETNHDKTEIILIYSKYRSRPLFSYFSMSNERLTTTNKARSLGVVFDDNMLFDTHVLQVQELIKDQKVSYTGV